MAGIRVTADLEIPAEQLQRTFARSSGPGGQNVNKVNSKATLRWTPAENFLSPGAWRRFQRLAQRFFTVDGTVVIQSQEHRDQAQNIEACERKLRIMIRQALVPPKPRVATKPTAASRRRRLNEKKQLGEKKQRRNFRPGTHE